MAETQIYEAAEALRYLLLGPGIFEKHANLIEILLFIMKNNKMAAVWNLYLNR
jgi:hypothetical protein